MYVAAWLRMCRLQGFVLQKMVGEDVVLLKAGGVVISSSGFGLFFVDEAAKIPRPVLLFFLRIQLVATAPRVSSVASYKGVTI